MTHKLTVSGGTLNPTHSVTATGGSAGLVVNECMGGLMCGWGLRSGSVEVSSSSLHRLHYHPPRLLHPSTEDLPGSQEDRVVDRDLVGQELVGREEGRDRCGDGQQRAHQHSDNRRRQRRCIVCHTEPQQLMQCDKRNQVVIQLLYLISVRSTYSRC